MAQRRRPRARHAPAPVIRLRPANFEARLKDIRAFVDAKAAQATTDAGRAEWKSADRVRLVNIGDMYGPEIWPEDSEVHEERARAVRDLERYRSAFSGGA